MPNGYQYKSIEADKNQKTLDRVIWVAIIKIVNPTAFPCFGERRRSFIL